MAKQGFFSRVRKALFGPSKAERQAQINRERAQAAKAAREATLREVEQNRAETRAQKLAETRRSTTPEAQADYLKYATDKGWINNGVSSDFRGSHRSDIGQMVRLAQKIISGGAPENLVTINIRPTGGYSLFIDHTS